MGIKDLFKEKKRDDEFGFEYDFLERNESYTFDEKPKKEKKSKWFGWGKKNEEKNDYTRDNPYSFAKYLDTIEDVQRKKVTSLTKTEKLVIAITAILIIYLLLGLKGLVPIF